MRRSLRQRGQALVETALVIVLLVLVTLGIVQFGLAFMQLNMITNAARDGARLASALASRDACGCLFAADKNTNIPNAVIQQISNVMDTSSLTVNVAQNPSPCASGVCPCSGACAAPPAAPNFPTVTVTVSTVGSGLVPYVFRFAGNGYSVNRSVTFRDERAAGG